MKQYVLHHHTLGHGPNILLAFHGIGQDGRSCFKAFADILGDYYTIYAFDLFYHGQSISGLHADNFPDPEIVTKDLWKETIKTFLAKEKITRFDVAGFSMGGRFALATLESFPNQINKALLIAPDGISEHLLYTFATRFSAARSLFRWSMRNPKPFLAFADLLQRAKLIHGSLNRFTKNVLDSPEKRQRVYNSWNSFRKLRFNIPILYQKIKVNNIALYLFIGKYDRLLNADAVKKLSRLLPADKCVVLQSGHSQLVEKVAIYLKSPF